MLELTHQL